MGSLSNLYISSSFQSLLHFGSDNTASVTLTEIEDGFGNGLGIYLNNSGSASFEGDVIVAGDLEISGAIDIEGAIVIRDNVYVTGSIYSSSDISSSRVLTGQLTASNAFITNDLNVGGTLFASKVVTLIESSSIIFSSGSNILGDETSDIQTLIGLVRVSGSSQLTGSGGITGNLNVLGNISSSTISGIGNANIFSQSVDQRLSSLQVASASLFVSVNNINTTTASLNTSASLALVTASFDNGTRNLTLRKGNNDTFSLNIPGTLTPSGTVSGSSQINIYETENYANFYDSIQFDISQKLFTSSFNSYTQSTNASLNSLSSFTASYSTTGSNTFGGNQVFSGSVRGVVIPLSVVSQTASMDLSLGNFFSLTLPTSSTTFLNPTNIRPGETVQLLVRQQSLTGSLNYPSTLLFATGSDYSASVFANAQDILSFVSFDTTSLYAVSIKNLV